MDEKEIFSQNLRHYIKQSGKNQSMIAEEMGVSRGTFSDWVNGRVYPRMNKVEKLAEYFGINKSDLVEEKSEDNDYYLNKEVAAIAQELYDNPDARALFSASRKLSKEDITVVKNLIERLTK